MAKEWKFIDHPADVGIEARADTPDELLEALAEALLEVILVRETVQPRESRALEVVAEDRAALAVDFLSELCLLVQEGGFPVASIRVRRAEDAHVVAEALGEPRHGHRHEYRTEVKAVTYHQLRFEQASDGWVGRVILDL